MPVPRPIAAFSLLLAAGCSAAIGSSDPRGLDRERGATVTVTNDNFTDVRIYVTRSTMRFRLGTVPSMDVRRFTIPAAAVGGGASVRLVAHPVGIAAPHRTEAISITSSQVIRYRIKKEISNSYYSVAARE